MKQKRTTITVEPSLGYFKRGDDMAHHLGLDQKHPVGTVSPADAFLSHAAMLEEDAKTLRRIAFVLVEVPEATVHADTHYIGITAPEAKLAGLLADEVVTKDPYEEDEEEEDDDDDFDPDEEDVEEEEGPDGEPDAE